MVVLDDVFDPLVAVQITSTLRFWLMTGSSLGNVDLGEILFTFQNIDEFPQVWVICSYIGSETAMPAFDCLFLVGHRESGCNYSRGQVRRVVLGDGHQDEVYQCRCPRSSQLLLKCRREGSLQTQLQMH